MEVDYFNDWVRLFDSRELSRIVPTVRSLYSKSRCLPAYNDIFRVFHITPYDKLCQLWLGQDPYNDVGSPIGVAFANLNSKLKLSPSLKVIKDSILGFEDFQKPIIFANDLSHLSKQGILLLNSALTVEVGKPMSHMVYWREFIKKFLVRLGEVNPGLIYVLWGNAAQSFENFISPNNIVYKLPHPAYYARQDKLIPHDVFVRLSEDNYKYYGRRIKWFEECQDS